MEEEEKGRIGGIVGKGGRGRSRRGRRKRKSKRRKEEEEEEEAYLLASYNEQQVATCGEHTKGVRIWTKRVC